MRKHPLHSAFTLLIAVGLVGSPAMTEKAQAGFEPFVGEIIMFGGNFAIRGYAKCDGQLLAISQNQALFSLLGTTYGGDGRTTFGLPDLRGRFAMHPGSGPGLTGRRLGQRGGVENVTLTTEQIPTHTHAAAGGLLATSAAATTADPKGAAIAPAGDTKRFRTGDKMPAVNMAGGTVAVKVENTGGGQAHTNMPPFQTITYLIALQGIFPSRS